MKYLLKDNFDNTEKIISEKELRDLYYKNMEEIIFNWKDCGDEKLIKGLEQERDNAYSCNINYAIQTLEEDNWFYKIEQIGEDK